MEHGRRRGGATPDGTFTATVPAVEGASYRATTPAASPAVTPRVTARMDVHVDVERKRRRTIVHVHTTPSVTGFTATLELYSRWHFRWRPRRQAKLNGHGHAAFRLPARRAGSPAWRSVAPAGGRLWCTAAS